MKLRFLLIVFRMTATLCKWANALHSWSWSACTTENLKSCNSRQPHRERFT